MTIEKIRAVLRSAVTWLTFLLLFLQVLIDQLSGLVSESVIGVIAVIVTRLGVVIVVIVEIIRRTEVLPKNKRGIL